MRSNFDTDSRIYAFPISELARVDELVMLYGADLSDVPKRADSPVTRCIAGGLDREGSDDLRSLTHPTTATTTLLTDGRHAYAAYWSLALIQAVQDGEAIAQELTPAELQNLRLPTPEL